MRQFWKKSVCLSMIVGMTCALSACGNEEENNVNSDIETVTTVEATTEEPEIETTVLTVVTDRAHLLNTKLAEYKAEFESKYEEDEMAVEIRFQVVENYEEEVLASLKSGEYGDVLLIPDAVQNEELAEYFEPLGTVEELSETYNEKYIQERTVDGVVYGLPRYVNVQGIAYNEIVFSKTGMLEFPSTSSDFLNMLQSMKDTQPDVIPYYTGYLNDGWLAQWQPHVWGAVSADEDYRNNGIVNEDDPFEAGKPNYVVHKLLYDIVDSGLCESFERKINQNFVYGMLNRGEIGCMVMSSEYLHDLQVADVNPDDISFMPFPYEKDGQQYVSVDLDYSYAINRNSPNKELAGAWIDYMLNDSGFATSEGAISIKKNAKLPDVLSNFATVELLVDNPATEENAGKYEELNELSGIYLDSDVEKIRLIQSASDETEERFDEIMEDWNRRWKDARNGVKFDSEEESGEINGL